MVELIRYIYRRITWQRRAMRSVALYMCCKGVER